MIKISPPIHLFLSLFLVSMPGFSLAGPPETGMSPDSIENKTVRETSGPAGDLCETNLNLRYLTGYFTDTGSILASPWRWRKKDWITASIVGGISIGLYAADGDIQDFVRRNRSSTTDRVAKHVKPFGNMRYTVPPLGALYFYGLFADNDRARRTGLLGVESLAIAGLFTNVLKSLTGRHRPITGDPYNTWDGPGLGSEYISFPSGHATAAFAVATVVVTEYSGLWIVPPVMYGLATLTALSRVNDEGHWASDAFVGSAVGFFTAKAVIHLHECHDKDGRLSLYPLAHGGQAGFGVAYEF